MVNSMFLSVDHLRVVSSLEDLLEMELLSFISNVNDSISFENIKSIVDCSHVCGVIVEASIFLDEEKRILNSRDKEALSSFVFNDEALFFEFIDNRKDLIVVEGLSYFLKLDIKSIVNGLELCSGDMTDHLPCISLSSLA
jgi:hypothetical protein